MKKRNFIVIFIIFLIIILSIYFNNSNTYNIKISFKFENLSAQDIDNNFCKNFENTLLNIPQIKDIISFCKENECNIYIKINFFSLNKEKIINEIYQKTLTYSNQTIPFKKMDFNRKYHLKYDYFIVLTDKNNDYFNLDKKYEEILENILILKSTKNVETIGVLDKAIYIYFLNDDLISYNLSISTIKELIQKNNINTNQIQNNSSKNLYPINIHGNYSNIEDIKNITIYYKNKDFSTKLYDIFEIKKKIKEYSDGYAFLNDKHAIILAISRKNLIYDLILFYKIKKIIYKYSKTIDFTIINPHFKKKIEIYLPAYSTIKTTKDFYKNLIKIIDNNPKTLGLIGYSSPKFKKEQDFTQIEKNKITLFTEKKNFKKITNFLKKNNVFYSINSKVKYEFDLNKKNNSYSIINQKIPQINYKIDEYLMRDYKLNKKEVLDSLLSQNDGLICDYFYMDNKIYEIILKNKTQNEEIFAYSNDYKTQINLNSFIKKEIKYDYNIISKKNKKPFLMLIKKE